MPITWTKEQKQVIDVRNKNMLVSAAAGSGKTAVLVERILSRIMDRENPVDVDRLLIVTFTRAAAGEMRERIGAAIEKQLEQDPDNEHLQRQSTLLHHAQISTIHGFCTFVIRSYFHTIGLDPGYRMADEGEQRLLREDAAEKVLEEAYEKADPEFLDFVENFATGKSDEGLKRQILRVYEFAMSAPWPEEWLEDCAAAYDGETIEDMERQEWMQDCFFADVRQSLDGAEAIAQKNLAVCRMDGGPDIYEPAIAADLELAQALKNERTYAGMQKKLQGSLAALSSKKGNGISPELREQVKSERERFRDIIKKLKADYFAMPVEEMVEAVKKSAGPVRVLTELTKAFIRQFAALKRQKNIMDFSDLEHFALQILIERTEERACRVTPAASELAERFEEVMVDEYQDTNLVQEYLVSFVSGGIRRAQRIHNRFMVGDVKQSIYRFRMARPELFVEKMLQYSQGNADEEQRIDLHKNFRSRKCVIDFVNLIFSQVMDASLGKIDYDEQQALYYGAEYPPLPAGAECTQILCVETDDEPDIPVAMEEIPDGQGEATDSGQEEPENEREMEARAVAGYIQAMVGQEQVWDAGRGAYRPMQYSDCVILLRTVSGWADVFSQVLMAQGVPAYATSRTGYFSALEVVTVLNYLRICDNPLQEIPFTAVLASPIGAFTTEELAKLKCAAGEEPLYTVFLPYMAETRDGQPLNSQTADVSSQSDQTPDGSSLQGQTPKGQYSSQEQSVFSGDAALADKVRMFMRTYRALRAQVSYTPIHELIGQILEETGYGDYAAAMPAGEQRSANLRMLVQRAAAFEETSYRGLFNFVRYIEHLQKYEVDFGEVSTLAEQADTVRIMSIHKSKGLEFPVVFLCGMGKKFNQRDTQNPVILHADYGIAADYIDAKSRVRYPSLMRQALRRQLVGENLGEELRVLYVALTRAKERLFLVGTVSKFEDRLKSCLYLSTDEDERLPYDVLRRARDYWDWVLPALARHPAFRTLCQEYGLQSLPVSRPVGTDTEIAISRISTSDLLVGEMREQLAQGMAREDFARWDAQKVRSAAVRDELMARFGFAYPYQSLRALPVKVSVSELKKKYGGVDEEAQEIYASADLTPIVPAFLRQEEEVFSGSDRGTAYHRVMECLDYGAFVGELETEVVHAKEGASEESGEKDGTAEESHAKDRTGEETHEKDGTAGESHAEEQAAVSQNVEKQIAKLLVSGKLDKQQIACIWTEDIVRFVCSPLGRRMALADREHMLFREHQFVLGIPAAELSPVRLQPAREDAGEGHVTLTVEKAEGSQAALSAEEAGENHAAPADKPSGMHVAPADEPSGMHVVPADKPPGIHVVPEDEPPGIHAAPADESPGETVLVQGIIDAYFQEDGKLVLVDYKTDSVKNGGEETLIKKYAVQLEYYAQALERLTDQKVKERMIYSFALGKEIVL